MKKRLYISVAFLLLAIFSLTACFAKQEYARVEIFSAKDRALLKSIDNSKLLKEIDKNIAMGETDLYTATEFIPEEEQPEYYFVFYMEPDVESSSFTLTVYEDSDFILDEFSTNDISVPPNYVMYRSFKAVQYLRGLL